MILSGSSQGHVQSSCAFSSDTLSRSQVHVVDIRNVNVYVHIVRAIEELGKYKFFCYNFYIINASSLHGRESDRLVQ